MTAEILRRAAALMRERCILPEGSRGYAFIDFPTGWAIQKAGLAHTDPKCSAEQTGGAMLCDCDALYPRWQEQRALLATAGWLDYMAEQAAKLDALAVAQEQRSRQQHFAVAVADAYLGPSA